MDFRAESVSIKRSNERKLNDKNKDDKAQNQESPNLKHNTEHETDRAKRPVLAKSPKESFEKTLLVCWKNSLVIFRFQDKTDLGLTNCLTLTRVLRLYMIFVLIFQIFPLPISRSLPEQPPDWVGRFPLYAKVFRKKSGKVLSSTAMPVSITRMCLSNGASS